MKSIFTILTACAMAVALVNCSGGGTASGPFGNIPAEIQKFKDSESSSNKDYKEKKAATQEKIEKMTKELSGKPVDAEVGTNLKIEDPITIELRDMNGVSPTINWGGKLVAAEDISLNVDPNDLKGMSLLGGAEVIVKVKMPVSMDCLAADGTVIKTYGDVGTLPAENLQTSAVVKAGTAVNFNTFSIVNALEGTQKLRFYIDPEKAAYTNTSLAE